MLPPLHEQVDEVLHKRQIKLGGQNEPEEDDKPSKPDHRYTRKA